MRIGVLTLPFNNNYGGILQAYALMTILKRDGHDVELIYRRHNKLSNVHILKSLLKNVLKLLIGKKIKHIIPNHEKELQRKGKLMSYFADKYISPKSSPLFSTKELSRYVKGRFEIIIVGSDQIWRPDYVPNIEEFYLTFLDDASVRRIAYAASFGSDAPKYTPQEKESCGKSLSKFNLVTVREQSGIEIIRRFGWKCYDPKVVLDPTLLLKKEDYCLLIQDQPYNTTRKLFCYLLDDSSATQRTVEIVASQSGEKPYYIIDVTKWKGSDYVMPPIEDWISGIRDAELVVTDSFHGMVFSIIFNKPFLVCVNEDRGATRIKSLLDMLELSCRMVSTYDEKKIDKLLNSPINWNVVNEKIDFYREESLMLLKSQLK
ncbi:MAG: polysaccharide pyruvyl transferase family protein [Paludibacteraceae bacterium]|nr:polysaccharide pyruvyl transferase family protein [Paludibacteraceae bacterium]